MNSRLCVYNLRALALALGNANTIYKVSFQGPKHITSGNAKGRYCKFFYNTTTVQFHFWNCIVAVL